MKFSIKERIEKIGYTLRHKKAFLQVEKKLRGKNTLRGYLHDMDKPFLYMTLLWLDKKEIQEIHRTHNRHHVRNSLKKTKRIFLMQ